MSQSLSGLQNSKTRIENTLKAVQASYPNLQYSF
jgi:hypothetical protein